jgi:hypothetical protein
MADETIGENLDKLGDSARRSKDAFISIGQELKKIKKDIEGSNEFFKDLTKSIVQGANESEVLAEAIERAKNGTASTKVLNRQAADSLAKQKDLQFKVNELLQKAANETTPKIAEALLKAAKLTSDAADNAGQLASGFEQAARANVELNKNAQFFDRMGKLASQIPGLGKLSGTFTDAAAAIRKADLAGKGFEEQITQGITVAAVSLAKAMGVEFLAQIFKVNKEITSFKKNLNLGYLEAIGVKAQFATIETLSNDIAINSVRLAEANAELNSQLGTAAVFSGELLGTFSKLTKVVGLSNEAAGSLAQQALISGQEFRTVEENALGTSYALQQASGVALNNKEILEATGKVTGQVRANLGSNPVLIAEAVTKAKLLGLELNNIADASKSLLSFESSIGNELEAELLTGKQLNLERARALALQGDLAGVADEIARQNINFSEFGAMNVLQQEALAKAVGMTADGLADSLLKQEAQGRTAKELRAIGKGDLADRLEALDAQEKLTLATEKFQVFLGNVATILSPVADLIGFIAEVFSTLPGKIALVIAILGKALPLMKKLSLSTMKTAIANQFNLPPPWGVIAGVAGAAAIVAAIAQTSGLFKADDMMYGNNMLVTKNKGAIALNNDDTIIAGTNLGGGRGRRRDDGEPGWLGKLISGINSKEVRFDSYAASGPQGIVNTERRQASNLFD